MNSLQYSQEERRDTDEAHEAQVVRRRQMDRALLARDGPDGDGFGSVGQCPVSQHDDGSGDGVSGQWATWLWNTECELAGVYNGEQPGGCSGPDIGGDCAGWFCECESGCQPWGDACGSILHGDL